MVLDQAEVARWQAERLEMLERLRVEVELTLEAYDMTLRTFREAGLSPARLEHLCRERERFADWLRKVELAIAGD